MAFKVRPRWNGKFQATVEAPGFPPVSGTFPEEGSARSWAIATPAPVLSGGFLPLKPKAHASKPKASRNGYKGDAATIARRGAALCEQRKSIRGEAKRKC